MDIHQRAAAFGGSDGHAYSVALQVDDEPDEAGRYGAALLYIRWTPAGDRPVGHVETADLAWGHTPDEAEQRIRALSLYDVKEALAAAIAAQPGEW
jgi:hypothetical protein